MKQRLALSMLVALLAASSARADCPGATFLMIFPDARTTALGGCGTALNDLDANAYYNPACLATGPSVGLMRVLAPRRLLCALVVKSGGKARDNERPPLRM